MTKLDEIEGIGASYAQSLKNAGIDTIEESSRSAATPPAATPSPRSPACHRS